MTHPSMTHTIWSRYIAIGDSFSEGLNDPDPTTPDQFLGWTDRLAATLDVLQNLDGPMHYANLAIRGRKIDDVVTRQLDDALALSPDLISMVGGGNDILRPKVDLDSLAHKLENAVKTIRAEGVDVLLATPVDPGWSPVFKPLRGRHGIHSANVLSIASRYGCAVVNAWELKAVNNPLMWSEDRIHMSTAGHERIAHAAVHALGLEPIDPSWRSLAPWPDMGTTSEQRRQTAQWAREHATPWVQRRLKGISSGDYLTAKRPALEPITSQWRHAVLGT